MHKLGPKANQGAINAGLRALDRSGKPCRRWEKKTLSLKSFTGVTWATPSWRSYKVTPIEVEVTSQNEHSSQPSESDGGKENKVNGDPTTEKSCNGMELEGVNVLSNGASPSTPVVASPA